MTRVAVIGARRHRQGIGEFVSRAFLSAGAELCAVVGTREETVAQACDSLREFGARDLLGFTDLEAAIHTTRPDVVAICSPFPCHRSALEIVAKHACHCLCEKPMWWNDGESDRAAVTEQLVDNFIARDRYLALITQWPQTLGDFYRLYPELEGEPVCEFDMQLGPTSRGFQMVLDAASHPLSMLQALLGEGDIEDASAEYSSADGRSLCLTFSYSHSAGSTTVRCQLETCEKPPRPASYALNKRWVHRSVELPDYRLFLEGVGEKRKRIPIEDPLDALVVEFVGKVESFGPSGTAGAVTPKDSVERRHLVQGVRGLEVLVTAAREAEERQVVQVSVGD